MTDHAKEAIKSLTFTSFYSSGSNHHHMALLEAQVHATLALAEQQRIANLVAILNLPRDAQELLDNTGVDFFDVSAQVKIGMGL